MTHDDDSSLDPEAKRQIRMEIEKRLSVATRLDIYRFQTVRQKYGMEHPYEFEFGFEIGLMEARIFYEIQPKYHSKPYSHDQIMEVRSILDSYAPRIRRKLNLLLDVKNLEEDR